MKAASEVALYKRHAFINQYLLSQGILASLLRRTMVLLLWQALKALFDPERRSLILWAERALERLPPRANRGCTARKLLLTRAH